MQEELITSITGALPHKTFAFVLCSACENKLLVRYDQTELQHRRGFTIRSLLKPRAVPSRQSATSAQAVCKTLLSTQGSVYIG